VDIGIRNIGKHYKIWMDKDGEFIPFSNRVSSKNELRGNILREGLDKLTATDPDISLYDALTKLVRDPTMMVKYFYSPIFDSDKRFIPPQGEYSSEKENIIKILSDLSSSCMAHVIDGKKRGLRTVN